MRFLADESCDFAVVRALRKAGYDVAAVIELSPRADDVEVMDLAEREARILLTEDKDFGQLVYNAQVASRGVMFLRFPARLRHTLPETVLDLVTEHGKELCGAFVVIQPGRIRLRRRLEK